MHLQKYRRIATQRNELNSTLLFSFYATFNETQWAMYYQQSCWFGTAILFMSSDTHSKESPCNISMAQYIIIRHEAAS